MRAVESQGGSNPCRIPAEAGTTNVARSCILDLDNPVGWVSPPVNVLPPASSRSLAFTLWLRASNFRARACEAAAAVRRFLADNPHTTLQIILEPLGDPRHLTAELLEELLAVSHESLSYLDWIYSLHPVRLLGAKRLVVLLPPGVEEPLDAAWRESIEDLRDDRRSLRLASCNFHLLTPGF